MKIRSLLACLSAALLLAACGQDATDDGPDETVSQKLDNTPGGAGEDGYPDDASWADAVANREATKKNNGHRPPTSICTTFVTRCNDSLDNCYGCRNTRARAHGHWSCEDPCTSAAMTCANAAFVCSL